jgi:predicted anti-sigma-YlaC factor YlaD
MSLKNKCRFFEAQLVRYVDGEISPEEKKKLEAHLLICSNCQKDLEHLTAWKGVSSEMKNKLLPDMAWEEYWQKFYNRLERGISWILISIGAIIILGIAAYHVILDLLKNSNLSVIEKTGVLVLVFGLIVLFVSVLREKLMIRGKDKYKEIVR